jgi:hypothetical protein
VPPAIAQRFSALERTSSERSFLSRRLFEDERTRTTGGLGGEADPKQNSRSFFPAYALSKRRTVANSIGDMI